MIIRNKPALILNLFILLFVAGIMLYVLFLTLSPDYETELRSQFGNPFFDDFALQLPADENDSAELETIIAKYEPHFISLGETAVTRLEELFEEALKDYDRQKQAKTLDRLKFSNKYIQAGRLLEKQADQAFYTLLNHMEKELKRKNLPTAIIGEIEETYAKAKEEKKKELFDRLRQKLQR